ncbi:hypothetical protein BJX63DRAFT_382211 [Aspergillus granulosus]|uniref:DUF7136 domain-containing protein n=1 Tax=Aspergillus granulosus TaxID=176169 RepID=A0ABR4HVI5_9EURO
MMHWFSATWWLVASLGAIVDASGLLEVDLVFPLNETYAPTKWFPVVFGFQNPQLAPLVDLGISFSIKDWDNSSNIIHWPADLDWSNNTSDDPYFFYAYFPQFNTSGRWWLTWHVNWKSCSEQALSDGPGRGEITRNSTGWSTMFTIEEGAAQADLVAATTNTSCPGEFGVPLNVTGQTLQVPAGEQWDNGGDCAVVVSLPTPTPDPCRIDITPAIVESMEASWHARLCRAINRPDDCPQDDGNGAQQLLVIGASSALAVISAVGFIFMHM